MTPQRGDQTHTAESTPPMIIGENLLRTLPQEGNGVATNPLELGDTMVQQENCNNESVDTVNQATEEEEAWIDEYPIISETAENPDEKMAASAKKHGKYSCWE